MKNLIALFDLLFNGRKYIHKWREINEPIGQRLGYPKCCVDEFCLAAPEILNNPLSRLTVIDHIRFDAAHVDGVYTGFIPCAEHARLVLLGKVKLADLIENRDINEPPFPDSWSSEFASVRMGFENVLNDLREKNN